MSGCGGLTRMCGVNESGDVVGDDVREVDFPDESEEVF